MARSRRTKLDNPKLPFWERASLGNKIAMIGLLVAIIGLPLAYYLGNPSREKDSREILSARTQSRPSSSKYTPSGFPRYFVRDTLYVLITRFEDLQEENISNSYGKGIERRIDVLVDSFSLPIVFQYCKELSPNQRREADILRDSFCADVVIWGKLKNASPECDSKGFCLQFELSDSLKSYAGGTITKPKLDDYQFGVAPDNFETELIRMGKELFDDWLVGMFNLKMQKQMLDDYAINEDWDDKKKLEAYFSRGNIQYNLGRYTESITAYDKAISINPASAHIYYNRGQAKSNLGRYVEALADYDKALSLNPEFVSAYLNRGIAQHKQGNYKEAIVNYEKAISIAPKNSLAYNCIGIIKTEKGSYIEAIANYDKAIAINPKEMSTYNNRSVVKNNLGLYLESIADCDKALEIDPRYSPAYYNRGLAKLNIGLYSSSISDYDQAIAINPMFVKAYINRAVSKKKLGLYKDAIVDETHAITLDPKFAIAYNNRAASNLRIGQIRSALSDYIYALWLDPTLGWPLYLILLGIAYLFKFKTINHFLLRTFQTLKKRLRS